MLHHDKVGHTRYMLSICKLAVPWRLTCHRLSIQTGHALLLCILHKSGSLVQENLFRGIHIFVGVQILYLEFLVSEETLSTHALVSQHLVQGKVQGADCKTLTGS